MKRKSPRLLKSSPAGGLAVNGSTNGTESPKIVVKSTMLADFVPTPARLISAKSAYEAAKKSQPPKPPKLKVGLSVKKSKLKKVATKSSKKSTKKKVAVSKKALQHVESLSSLSESDGSDLDDSNHHITDVEMVEDSNEVLLQPNKEQDTAVDYQTLEEFDFLLVNPTTVLAFIPFQTCFYFKGRLNVTVLSGIAEMQGFTMDEDPVKSYRVYSPRGYSLMCIRSVGKKSGGNKLNRTIYPLLKNYGLNNCTEDTLNQKSIGNTFLLLQTLDSNVVDYLSRLFPVNIFRREECIPPAWEDVEIREQFSQLCTRLDSSVILRGAVFSARFYQQPDAWADYTQQLMDKAKLEPIRLMLCGGKGVGKSTLLRFIANRLIKRFGSVLVVDFDPGQSEFLPAGTVSATLVTEPLLGPNFTHFQQPLYSYFVGDVDITTCPDRYIQSCRRLLNDCRMGVQLNPVPMLFNTMGFTSGVGLDMILDLIRLIHPLQVLQLSSRSSRRNFPSLLEWDCVAQHRRGWITGVETELPDYSLEVVYSAAEFTEKSLEEWGLRPRELRHIGIMSYFGRLSTSPQWCLTDAIPYRISWQGLALCICHDSVPPELTMAAINASLVALCHLDIETAASVPRYQAADGKHPTILREMPLMPCLGYGVVRGVDLVNGYIYLITPEPIDRLNQVNCLVMGGIQLPEKMLLDPPEALRNAGQNDGAKCRVPYVTCGPSQPACLPYRKYNPVFTLRKLT